MSFTYPLELVRTRMAFRICDGASCDPYSTVSSCLRDTVRRNGFLGLYTGVGATLLGALPFEGIKFGTNDFLKQRLPRGEDGRLAAPILGLPILGLPVSGLPILGLPVLGLPILGLPILGLPILGLPYPPTPTRPAPLASL